MNGITNYVWKCDGDGGQRRAEEEQTPVKMKKRVETQAKKKLKRTAILVSQTTQHLNPNPQTGFKGVIGADLPPHLVIFGESGQHTYHSCLET